MIELPNGSRILNCEMIRLPNGKIRFVDEHRYNGFGMKVLDRSKGKCEICGNDDKVILHRKRRIIESEQDLVAVCYSCHGILISKSSQKDKKVEV